MGCGPNWKDFNYDVYNRKTNQNLFLQPKTQEEANKIMESQDYAVQKVKKAPQSYQKLTEKYSDSDKKWTDPQFPPQPQSIGNAELSYVPKWKRVKDIVPDSQFMVDDANPEDIIQGGLGDCYLLSAVSALAQKPERIQRLFPDTKTHHDTGVYMVKMKVKGVKQEICVDDWIPVDQYGKAAFIQPHGRQFWPLILQKAWAKVHGSYGAIIAGFPHQCLNALSSAPTIFNKIPKQPLTNEHTQRLQNLWKQLLQGEKQNWAMCAGTIQDQEVQKMGLVLGHAYTLLAAYQIRLNNRQTERLMKLRNPWGKRQWKGRYNDYDTKNWSLVSNQDKQIMKYNPKKEDGIFFMGWDQFIYYFDMVDICKIHEDYTFIYEEVKQKKKNGQMFRMDIRKEGKVFITVHQKDLRGLPAYAQKLGYARVTLVVGKLIGPNQYRYISSLNQNYFPDTQMELVLNQGTYIVFAKCDWVRQDPDQFTLSVYSQNGSALTKQQQSDHKNFLNKIFFNYASTHDQGKKFVSNSQQDWYFIKPLYYEGAYGIIAASVQNLKLAMTGSQVEFNRCGWKFKDPYKGTRKNEFVIEPGKNFILLCRGIDNFPGNLCKFPPSSISFRELRQLKQ